MKKVERFVLDCSVALSWYFADEANPYADAVAALFANAEVLVPALWHLEVANAVLMGERRKRSTTAQAAKWLGYLGSLPVAVDPETTARAWTDTLHLARAHGLTAYDAAYLELALRTGRPLATRDGRLKAACAAVGVPVLKP